ncbi:MAG TPA: PAS domain-containing protein [bacterium]|nr:PAS domain-containing protein [bacterium]
MGKTLRVLIAANSAEITHQIITRLKRAGFSLNFTCVKDRQDFKYVIRRERWDVIIVDHDLSDIGGFYALELMQRLRIDRPIIFLSDSINEAILLDALIKGATGFISKKDISPLISAVWNETRYAQALNDQLLLENEMKLNERFLQEVFNTVQEGICVLDNHLNILKVNSWIRKTFSADKMINGKKCYQIFRNSESCCSECDCSQTLKSGQIYREDFSVVHDSENVRWYDMVSYPLKNSDGKVIGVIQSIRDITRRKLAEQETFKLNQELEQRVAVRTAQLAVANKELESFSYSVSHDLRAPLVRIDGFSQLLIDNFSDKIDDEARHYLQRIRSSVLQMSQLIDDLLLLSRVTRSVMKRTEVDLSSLAKQITDSLQESDPQRQVQFAIKDGVKVNGDLGLLRLALENLINNAWKFTQKTNQAKIEIGLLNGGPDQVVFIRDNGAGFDKQHSNKLFSPFQRLHSEKDFPGNGIGLATVQRIIHRHGGKIWAEGQLNQGATFYFTLHNNEKTS